MKILHITHLDERFQPRIVKSNAFFFEKGYQYSTLLLRHSSSLLNRLDNFIFKTLGISLVFVVALFRSNNFANSDVVIVHDIWLFPSAYFVKYLKKSEIKLILDMHEVMHLANRFYAKENLSISHILRPIWKTKMIEKLSLNWCSSVSVVSEEMKDKLVTTYGSWFLNKCSVIENLEYDKNFPFEFRKSLPIIINYTGGFSPHRGLIELMESLKEIGEIDPMFLRNFHFVFVGAKNNSYCNKLKKAVLENGLLDIVTIEDWVNEVSPAYLKQFDAGIIPHIKSEHTNSTTPHKLYTYINKGLPVIATQTNSFIRLQEKYPDWIYTYDKSTQLYKVLEQIKEIKDIEGPRPPIWVEGNSASMIKLLS